MVDFSLVGVLDIGQRIMLTSLLNSRQVRLKYLTTLLDFILLICNTRIVVIKSINEIVPSDNKTIYALNGYTSQGHYNSSLLDLLMHIAGGSGHVDDITFTPLPSTFIDSNYRKLYRTTYIRSTGEIIGSGTDALVALGILSRINYNQEMGICFGFKLPSLLEAGFGVTEVTINRRGISSSEIKKGYHTKDTILSADMEDFSVVPNLDIYKKVMEKYDRVSVNKTAYDKSFKDLLGYVESDKSIIEVLMIFLPPKVESLKEIARKYLIDSAKLLNVCDVEGTPGRYTYLPQFAINSTGRMTEINGIQGITRLSKGILHNHPRVRNYDIRASQMCALQICLADLVSSVDLSLDDLMLYDLNIEHLNDYVASDSAADDCANQLGISKSDWKRIIYSVVFGSDFESEFSTASNLLSAYKHVNWSYWAILKSSLFIPVMIWRKYIRDYSQVKSVNNTITNGLVTISLDSEKLNGAKGTRWLSAFYLQGLETSFIFEVVTRMNNRLISYEYDGLVVDNDISDDIIEQAKHASGFTTAELILKSFNDSDNVVNSIVDSNITEVFVHRIGIQAFLEQYSQPEVDNLCINSNNIIVTPPGMWANQLRTPPPCL